MKRGIAKRVRGDLMERRGRYGWFFVAPFVFGFVMFFLWPMFQSLYYSFFNVKLGTETYLQTQFCGLENYRYLIFVSSQYRVLILKSVGDLVPRLLTILIFSFFVATLLNQKFRGRTIVRAIMFLPIIYVSNISLNGITAELERAMEQNATFGSLISSEADTATGLFLSRGSIIYQIINSVGALTTVAQYATKAISELLTLINRSGIQILIFLAGLQTVPRSLYEASTVEGATGWESFWKITFPMVSPMILVNTIYTVVDAVMDPGNAVMQEIQSIIRQGMANYGMIGAMSWLYFAGVFVLIGAILFIMNKFVFYNE